MSESVYLPALGESVTEGTVTRWLKNVGDHVEVDEPLLEVSTDKVDTEIPSPVSGVIEAILVKEDETVAVGTALVTIGSGVASEAPAEPAPAAEVAPAAAPAPEVVAPPAPSFAPPAATPTFDELVPAPAAPAPVVAPAPVAAPAPVVAPEPVAAPAPVATPVAPVAVAPVAAPAPAAPAVAPVVGSHAASGYVTPIVRKLANDHGVNLQNVIGTGVGGRIRKQDILDAQAPSTAAAPAPVEVTVSPLRGTTQPMSRLRKVVAERAVASMQSTAQLTSVVEVDVTAVAALRDRVKDAFFAKTGNKLSFMPFFALAAVEALQASPIINSTVDGDTIVYPAQENLAIAVDTERGLLTPVIRDAAALDIAGFAAQIADLADRTRNNQLKPDELAGGTFTLTNTGSRGALFDTPVVFLPQSAILGTGVVVKRPAVLSQGGTDAIAIRSMVYLALSYDHRHIDGADAARFLGAVKARLEAGNFEGSLGI